MTGRKAQNLDEMTKKSPMTCWRQKQYVVFIDIVHIMNK
jgi:hypothetical protein